MPRRCICKAKIDKKDVSRNYVFSVKVKLCAKCISSKWMPIDPKCKGEELDVFKNKNPNVEVSGYCKRIIKHGTEEMCRCYIKPSVLWRHNKKCPLASHIEEKAIKRRRIRVGQQKQRRKW